MIHERTDGNPLFMISVVDYLVDAGFSDGGCEGLRCDPTRGRSRAPAWPDRSFLPRQSWQRSSDRFAKRSGNVDEEECVFGKRFIPAVHFYCHLKDVFRLGFLTSSADHVLTTIMADEFFIGAESQIADSVSLASFLLSNIRMPISQGPPFFLESCLLDREWPMRGASPPLRRSANASLFYSCFCCAVDAGVKKFHENWSITLAREH